MNTNKKRTYGLIDALSVPTSAALVILPMIVYTILFYGRTNPIFLMVSLGAGLLAAFGLQHALSVYAQRNGY